VKPLMLRLAVVLLAVALGLGLGAGPLQRSNSERDKQLAAQKAQVTRKQHRIDALQSAAAFGDAFAAATGPALIHNTLAGHSVALVTLPGADASVVAKLRGDVEAAQGKITAEIDLAQKMAGSSSRQLVEALTSQMLQQTAGLTVPADAGGYQRFGALLARALGTGPKGQPDQAAYDTTAVSIVSGLQSADLVTVKQPVSSRAGLVLVVTGREFATDAAAAENAVPSTILQAFGQQVPTVVVGPTGAAGSRGVIGALRGNAAASAAVSTVDSSETSMGQLTAILALAARARGTVGQYGGVKAANGVVPGAKS